MAVSLNQDGMNEHKEKESNSISWYFQLNRKKGLGRRENVQQFFQEVEAEFFGLGYFKQEQKTGCWCHK